MGLSATVDRLLGRLALGRLHVLPVEVPGAGELRMRLEHACRVRGWPLATSPADADLLVVCGSEPHGDLAAALDRVWQAMPGPRVRGTLSAVPELPGVLDELAADYLAWNRAEDPLPSAEPDQHGGHDMGDHDMGDMDMGDHMGDMDMGGPGGIALASGADDRDGLEMDVLHLPLGPALPDWPAGLSLLLTLQGDVVAAVEVTAAQRIPVHDPFAYRLDWAARLLQLTGAGALADRVLAARDHRLGLTGSGPDPVDLRRRIARSWPLKRALRGVGPVDAVDVPVEWGGDCYDRLLRLVDPGNDRTAPGPAVQDLPALAELLPGLLTGSELADVRLTVASLAGLAFIAAETSAGSPVDHPVGAAG
ncbi:hypothetical protein FHX74_000482 [Friedmanniella endophytica]|uniref:Uncharacterized protein n=1 Tax=Microlunatus kandeliicorticis TaxID=1759536 RepID=A0A7W3IPK1_9ACTN|nr:hypothetical protein [Microlunatus kandeliicorticis]MBA8792888.1 hypothetical protein [Microlunatus kandeliicorticis]